jgi:glutamate synthase (NADPH/NADH) large chain
MDMVELETLTDEDDMVLKALIEKHAAKTGSDVAQRLLADWANTLTKLIKVMPVDYKRIQQYMQTARESGKYDSEDQISAAAFDMHIENLKQPKKAPAKV